MAVIEKPASLMLERREVVLEDYRNREPLPSDVDHLIERSALVYDKASGDLAITYLLLDDDVSELTAALRRVEYVKSQRPSGLQSQARIFGHQPRSLPRRDFCTTASLAADDAYAHGLVTSYAEQVSRYYLQYAPETFQRHVSLTDRVLDEWKLHASPFTSGIINRNNPLRYHFDSGNHSGVWSNMIVLRYASEGGTLAVPEFNVRFALPHNSLLMFDGQQLLHGVTPILLPEPDSVRFSIVFYSLKQMWNCLTITDEVIRARKRRTERELRRIGDRPVPHDVPVGRR